MVECRLCKADAVGSSPSTSTIYIQQKGHMEQHEKNLLKESLYADDIDLLILAIRRLEDELEHAKNMLPLYAVMVVVLLLVTYIPDISLLLPRLLMGYAG